MSKHLLGSLALAALMASVATAQTSAPTTPRQGAPAGANGAQTAGQPGQAGQAGQLDQGIAACLYLTNQEEVAIAQFAEGRAEHAEVKKFVEMILKDHRDALQKLQAVSPQLASMNLQLTGAEGDNAGAAGTQGRAPLTTPATTGQADRQGAQAGGDIGASMVALQHRVAQECLSLTQKELSEKKGAEFDRCFIGQQMGAHLATLAKLRGSREFASPQLQQFIDEATKVVEHHIVQAKQIAKKLEGEYRDDAAQARRDGSEPRRQ